LRDGAGLAGGAAFAAGRGLLAGVPGLRVECFFSDILRRISARFQKSEFIMR
jgi:hypothetical protein